MNKRHVSIWPRLPLEGDREVVLARLCTLALLGLTSTARLGSFVQTAVLSTTGVLAAPVPSSSGEPDADSALDTIEPHSDMSSPMARDPDSSNADREASSGGATRSDTEPDVSPTSPEQQSSLGAALQTIREQLQRQERPLGSRGSQCPYSPGLVGANDTIWSDRPVFLWRSTGQTLTVYDYETDELLWQQQVEAGTEAVAYDGDPLQPGGLYRWVLMHPQTSDFNATFLVMEAAEREALSAELSQAQERWTAANMSPTEQALERAMFFSDRRLWSDALQELHAVRDSAEVGDTIHEISVYLCGALESDIQALEPNR